MNRQKENCLVSEISNYELIGEIRDREIYNVVIDNHEYLIIFMHNVYNSGIGIIHKENCEYCK